MARARLRDRHQENLKKKLNALKAEQGVAKVEDEIADSHADNESVKMQTDEEGTASAGPAKSDESQSEYVFKKCSLSRMIEKNVIFCIHCNYCNLIFREEQFDESGSYSPKYIPQSELEPGTIVTLEEEDAQRLEFARNQVVSTGRKVQSVLSAEEQAMRREVSKNMDSDEAQFSVESSLEAQVYLWSDKYRPRKPRYFNMVHTGFEWNKYNQTHYDMDNPPPKIVQGYKFNIFYPDLIDKNVTPEYFLVRYLNLSLLMHVQN